MPISPSAAATRCRCGRPAACPTCGLCVLHCHCPSPEEIAAAHRRRLAVQRGAIISHVERHVGQWEQGNHGETVIYDGRQSHVGNYLALDPDGTLWLNRYHGDGRGMTDYNYMSRLYQPPANGPTAAHITADLAQLADGQLLPDERIRRYRNGDQ